MFNKWTSLGNKCLVEIHWNERKWAFTCRSGCTWMALLQCVCGSVASARHCGQSASHSPPMSTYRASHLTEPWKKKGEKGQKVSQFITISTSNFTRLNYSCSLLCRLPPLGFPPKTQTHTLSYTCTQPRGGQAEQFYTTAILMSQHTQLAVNEVFQHCSMLIHNPKFTLKWISFCSLYYHTSAHPCTRTHTHSEE